MTTVLNTLLTQHDVGAGADPNDIQFTHTGAVDASSGHSSTTFATITIPAGAEATLHYVYILELCGGVDGNQCTSFYG